MALTDFRTAFDNAYETVFQKVLVAKESVANMRFEPTLRYGESVERVAYDITNVRVRSVTRGAASTIDTVTDSGELLEINLEKEAVFHISDGERTQAGPLNPGEKIGTDVAKKVALDLDARIFAEIRNATFDFDNGDLAGTSSTGTGITLNSTTVPQMVSRMAAKLRFRNNQDISGPMIMVTDSYALSDITQYVMGKNIDLAGNVFQNGYSGDVGNARVYVSENLTGEAVLSLATQPTAGDTLSINGVTLTGQTTIGVTAGNFLIGANVDATRANLAGLINNPGTTSATQVALSAANQLLFTDDLKLTATNNDTTNKLTLVGIGSGRLLLGEVLTDATDTWSSNVLHTYFGKRGGIDVVVQDMKPVDMRETADRRGTNVFSSYLAGIKTFADSAKTFLDVLIAVPLV